MSQIKIVKHPPEVIEVDQEIIDEMKRKLTEVQLNWIIENDPLGVL